MRGPSPVTASARTFVANDTARTACEAVRWLLLDDERPDHACSFVADDIAEDLVLTGAGRGGKGGRLGIPRTYVDVHFESFDGEVVRQRALVRDHDLYRLTWCDGDR